MDNGFDNLYRRKILRLNRCKSLQSAQIIATGANHCNRCKSLQPAQIIATGANHCAATIIKFLNFQIIEFSNFIIFAV
jgi:hypothetical protein